MYKIIPKNHRVAPDGRKLRERINIGGLPIHIEYWAGETKKTQWGEIPLLNNYGRIPRTRGRDEEHIDVYLGVHTPTKQTFVIDLYASNGSFDEQKVMIGFINQEQAEKAFDAHYTRAGSRGKTTVLSFREFVGWCMDKDNWGRLIEKGGGTPEQQRRNSAKYRSNPANKHKLQARWRVQSKVKSGGLKKSRSCSACGRQAALEAHHTNHKHKERITWLCKRCHEKRNKK
jgi:hypothetical protein